MNFKTLWMSCMGFAVLVAASVAWGDAILENFDVAPDKRVPGEYGVLFKRPSEFAGLYNGVTSALSMPAILPDTLPANQESLAKLASALAKSAGGRLGAVMFGVNDIASEFVITGLSDSAARILAKDPRIALISAGSYAIPDTSQVTLHDPLGLDDADYLWHLLRLA